MKVLVWIEESDLSITEAALRFKTSYSNVYKYMYHNTIPEPEIMLRICEATGGLVTANDFYNITPEYIQQIQIRCLKEEKNRKALL